MLCAVSFWAGYKTQSKSGVGNQSDKKPEYPLLAGRLFVENPNDVIINFTDLRSELTSYMEKNGIQGSLYFEYLPTGTSVRVQGDDELVAASLMKIPVIMELFRAAELGRIDLDKKNTLAA